MFDHHLTAQASPTAGHAAAMAELAAGHKTGHWIWYVFPQLAGLGTSEISRKFALADHEEAALYLAHPTLGPRLLQAMQAVRAQLDPPASRQVVALMGGPVDAQKLVSSCTLFGYVAQLMLRDKDKAVAARALGVATVCREIQEMAERQGLQPDLFTLDAMPDGPRCAACGGQPAPDPPTGSSIAPCSYGRCLMCQQEMIEAEFIFESVHEFWDNIGAPEYIGQTSTIVDGNRVYWKEWQELRGLPIRTF